MPAPGPDLVSMAQQFTGLPMNQLIGAPLKAAAEANTMMAATQVQFMLDLCFQKQEPASENDTVDQYIPIMVDLKLTRPVIETIDQAGDGVASGVQMSTVETTISLPILTIVPLNSLAVDDVSVEFVMEVKSSYSEDTSSSTSDSLSSEGSFSAKIGWGVFSAEVKGSVSKQSSSETSNSTHYEKSNSAQYTVKVHAGQLPLPPGVTTIIDAYANAITPIEVGSAQAA